MLLAKTAINEAFNTEGGFLDYAGKWLKDQAYNDLFDDLDLVGQKIDGMLDQYMDRWLEAYTDIASGPAMAEKAADVAHCLLSALYRINLAVEKLGPLPRWPGNLDSINSIFNDAYATGDFSKVLKIEPDWFKTIWDNIRPHLPERGFLDDAERKTLRIAIRQHSASFMRLLRGKSWENHEVMQHVEPYLKRAMIRTAAKSKGAPTFDRVAHADLVLGVVAEVVAALQNLRQHLGSEWKTNKR